jgi:hypothetical protein
MYKSGEDQTNFNFFNFKNDLDYSMSSSGVIDNRVLEVCKLAEKNYLENQKTIENIQRIKDNDARRNQYYSKMRAKDELEYKKENDYKNNTVSFFNKNPIKTENINYIFPEEVKNEINLSPQKEQNLYSSKNFQNNLGKSNEKQKNTQAILKREEFRINNKLSNSHNHSGKKCVACELKNK